jgi:hypothetical protein
MLKKSVVAGAGKKGGWFIGKWTYLKWTNLNSDIFDDVISDMSISHISRAKNGHIGLDISEI